MVTRLPPPTDGSSRRTSGLVAILVVVALALGVWFLNGGDPGTSTTSPDDASSSASATDTPPSGTDDGERALGADPDSGLPYVDAASLPDGAARTLDLIASGGPFPYSQDGEVFGNFEGLLPDEERGYYREFTVETPGSDDRGARRIVEGADGQLYWTDDHYSSFSRIRE